MARNTLEAVFGALGAGLTGYGRDAARRREEEQTRLDRERQAERDRLAMFEAGLEPSADVQGRRQRLTQATQATQAMAGAPMPGMSAVGPALAAATRAMGEDVDRGRRITVGGTEYVQPFSRTAQGIEERGLQRQAQQASIARQQQLADDEAEREFQRQRDAANAEQNRLARQSAERIAGIRSAGTGAVRTGGRATQDLPPLPTVVRAAQEVAALNREDVLGMNPAKVYAAATAPLLAAEPTVANIGAAGLMNVYASGGLFGGRGGMEPLYAQYVGSVSDAAARIGERIGVLTNQDIARYRALTTPLPGDSDEMKLRKWENLRDLSQFLVDMRSVAENPTEEALAALRQRAANIGAATEREMYDAWSSQNPRRQDETPAQHVTRFRQRGGR